MHQFDNADRVLELSSSTAILRHDVREKVQRIMIIAQSPGLRGVRGLRIFQFRGTASFNRSCIAIRSYAIIFAVGIAWRARVHAGSERIITHCFHLFMRCGSPIVHDCELAGSLCIEWRSVAMTLRTRHIQWRSGLVLTALLCYGATVSGSTGR